MLKYQENALMALQLLHDMNLSTAFTDQDILVAICYGHDAVLQFLVEVRKQPIIPPIIPKAMDFAAQLGRLEMIKYLYEKGGKCTPLAFESARGNGHVEVYNFLKTAFADEFLEDEIKAAYQDTFGVPMGDVINMESEVVEGVQNLSLYSTKKRACEDSDGMTGRKTPNIV
jgi:hypothetical protein